MDDTHTPIQPSRRNIFATDAALAVAAASSDGSPDANVLTVFATCVRQNDFFNSLPRDGGAAMDAEIGRLEDLQSELAMMPVRTLEGMRCKARVLIRMGISRNPAPDQYPEDQLVASLLRDLVGEA